MDGPESKDPQQMLESLFKTIYEKDASDEALRIQQENELYSYQIEWCNKFLEVFSFVSQYGGSVTIHTHTDFEVKFHKLDKCLVSVSCNGYCIEVHSPMPGTDKCRCLEHYVYESINNTSLSLTLPEITLRISKGIAKANADRQQLKK